MRHTRSIIVKVFLVLLFCTVAFGIGYSIATHPNPMVSDETLVSPL